MAGSRPDDSPQVIPYLYYHDATKALDFLVEAFGFEVKSALRDDNVSEPEVHFSDNKIYVAADSGGQQWILAQPSDPSDSVGEER